MKRSVGTRLPLHISVPGRTGTQLALDIDTHWTQEVFTDTDLVASETDPKSRMGASRSIGRSASIGRVLAVIAYRDLDNDLHGVNAWSATGADLAFYAEGVEDG